MVIKKNPKTGKYYVAPSPPSFYKPKPRPSTKPQLGSRLTPTSGIGTGSGEAGKISVDTGKTAEESLASVTKDRVSFGRSSGRSSGKPKLGSRLTPTSGIGTGSGEAGKITFKKDVPDIVEKRIQPVTPPRVAPGYQERYIESLKSSPTSNLEIQAYGGVRLPYGQKDIKWKEEQFGTISTEQPTGYKEVSLIGTMQEQERIDPDISKPRKIIYQEKAKVILDKIQEDRRKANKELDISLEKIQSKIDSGEISKERGREVAVKLKEDFNKKDFVNWITSEETKKANKELDISLKTVQAKIDSGEISKQRGREIVVKLNEDYNKNLNRKIKQRIDLNIKEKITTGLANFQASGYFKDKFEKAEQFKSVFDTSFSPEFKKTKAFERAEAAADIVSLVSPTTTALWFIGKGFYKGAKGGEKDILTASYSPSGELEAPRYMDIASETKIGAFGVPYRKITGLSKESREAGVSLLFGATGAFGKVFKTGAEITALRRAELIESPWTVTSKELFKVGDETLLQVTGSKSIGTASAEGKAFFPVEVGKKGAFKIMAGEGEVGLRVVDFMKQGAVKPGKDIVKSTIDFGLGGRGTTAKGFFRGKDFIAPTKDMFVTGGEGYVAPRSIQNIDIGYSKFWSAFTKASGKRKGTQIVDIKFDYIGDGAERFLFGGLARKEGEKLIFASGRLSKARLYPKDWRLAGRFKPETFGETLVQTAEKDVVKSFKGGAKSSKEFLRELSKPPRISKQPKQIDFTPSATSPSLKLMQPSAGVSTKETSAYAGTGLYEKAIAQQFGGTSFKSAELFAVKGLIPKTTYASVLYKPTALSFQRLQYGIKPKTDTKVDTKVKLDFMTRSDTILDTMSKLDTRVKLDTKVKQATKVRTKTKQKTVLEEAFPITPTMFTPEPRGKLKGQKSGWGLPPILFGVPSLGGRPTKKRGRSYIPQVKSKKKWRNVGRRMDYNSALSRASEGADLSTARSMRVRPSNKAPQVRGVRGWSMRQHKFRRGKRPGVYVEKKKFIGDTRSEIAGLGIAKLKKNMGWGLPIQQTKRKSKKKRRAKSQWLV